MGALSFVANAMPRSLAERIVKNDAENGSIDENLVEAEKSFFQAVPVIGTLVPAVGLAWYADRRRNGYDDRVGDYLKPGAILPVFTLFGGPVSWAINAAVNLGWSAADFAQAAALTKLKDG